MMPNRILRRDNKGIGAVEFALIAPVLISFVIGVSQVGKLFYANADMKNAMAAGARVASVWPVPEDPQILAAVNARLARSSADASSDVEIARGTDAKGNDYVDIEMTYDVPLEFIFFNAGPVTLSDTRRVFIQMSGVLPTTSSSTTGGTTTGGTSSAGTTTSTTSTTSGGTSSTSATSAGGTSSTSATSAGGTTTSASTSSTTSSTTSSSGNGNSNGNSSHGHGNCNKKCS